MFCPRCRRELEVGARFCPNCGGGLRAVEDDGDSAATTAWRSGPVELRSDDSLSDEPLVPAKSPWPKRAALLAVAGVVVAGAVYLATRGGSGTGAAKVAVADSPHVPAGAGEPSISGSATDDWWTPPSGPRTDVDALAYAFAGIDEKDLGTVFDADLKPVYGAPKLFEDHEPRHVPRGEFFSQVIELRDSMQLNAGFSFLFVDLSTHQSSTHDYKLYRAVQVADVFRVDESKRMRKPPDDAVFYLAEVDRGASYDVMVEGDFADMGSRLGLIFEEGTASLGDLKATGHYTMNARGLGLQPKTGDAIFARTPEQIAARYQTTKEPVPIKLVFRTIPGRHFHKKELPVPKPVIDDQFDLPDGKYKTWRIARGGRFRIQGVSQPSGMGVTWSAGVNCDSSWTPGDEFKTVDSTCSVPNGATLTISNPPRSSSDRPSACPCTWRAYPSSSQILLTYAGRKNDHDRTQGVSPCRREEGRVPRSGSMHRGADQRVRRDR